MKGHVNEWVASCSVKHFHPLHAPADIRRTIFSTRKRVTIRAKSVTADSALLLLALERLIKTLRQQFHDVIVEDRVIIESRLGWYVLVSELSISSA